MGTVSLFHGSAICEVAEDGSVPCPDFLAEALDGDAGDLLVSKHETDACLIGYGRGHLATLHDRAEARRIADEARGADARNHYHRLRRTFGIVDRLPRRERRITIPPAMRRLGKIETLALFVGAGDSFEIWNPAVAMACDDPTFRDLVEFRLAARDGDENPIGVH